MGIEKWKNGNELLADDLYENPLAAFAVEFTVENLLPRSEIKFSVGNSDDRFASHESPLEMGVGVVLSDIMRVLVVRMFRGEFLQPALVIRMESGFVVIDENAGGNVHRVDQS